MSCCDKREKQVFFSTDKEQLHCSTDSSQTYFHTATRTVPQYYRRTAHRLTFNVANGGRHRTFLGQVRPIAETVNLRQQILLCLPSHHPCPTFKLHPN